MNFMSMFNFYLHVQRWLLPEQYHRRQVFSDSLVYLVHLFHWQSVNLRQYMISLQDNEDFLISGFGRLSNQKTSTLLCVITESGKDDTDEKLICF